MNNEELAELIFPDVKETLEDLDRRYPPRNLPEGAKVTRFAPSPTGFLHTGGLFTSLVARTVGKQTGGVFYLRLEDTDQKREIAGAGKELIEQLQNFGIVPDEGYFGDSEKGEYGPYVQSKRADIYKVVIKEFIKRGRAYPCFCTPEDLNLLRTTQEANKVIPGYYGLYAKCRNYSNDEAAELIKAGKPYVIRFKSMGDHTKYIRVHDLIRGDLNLSQNDQDIVIMKSDGLPTYHFAHLVDDHYMGTTTITRGEEWLSSLPIHLELFEAIGWKAPEYAHLPVIMKIDENGSRRKLSKRKDAEAAVSYFIEKGYPVEGIIKYLLTIANSNFEEWLREHPLDDVKNFTFSFNKMSLDGALFDLPKLRNISKEVLAYKNVETIYNEASLYASKYDENLKKFILKQPEMFKSIMNIERNQEHPRKDYEVYSDVFEKIKFFDNEIYDEMLANAELPFNPYISKDLIKTVLQEFSATLNIEVDESSWFASLKELGAKHGFASSVKEYKKDKDSYVGHIGDVAEMIRICLTTSKNSPNLYSTLKILTPKEVRRRIDSVIQKI